MQLHLVELGDANDEVSYLGTKLGFELLHSKLGVFEYVMEDGRKVTVTLSSAHEMTEIIVVFDPETENPIEMQRGGWQAILDNFKKYVESVSS